MSTVPALVACLVPAVIAAAFAAWQDHQDPERRALDRMARHDRRCQR